MNNSAAKKRGGNARGFSPNKPVGRLAGLLASTSTTPGQSSEKTKPRARVGKKLFSNLEPIEIIRIEKSTPFVRQGKLLSAEGSTLGGLSNETTEGELAKM